MIQESSHGDWLLMSCLIANMNPLVGAQFLDYMEDYMDTSSTVDLDDIEDHIDINDKIESTD